MKSKIYEDMCIVNFTLQPANVNFGGKAAKTLRCSGLQILCQKTPKEFFDSLSRPYIGGGSNRPLSETRDSMPTEVTNYQCPACTGPLHFEGSSGKLECEYCGSSYAVAEIEALYAEKDAQAESAHAAAQASAEASPSADSAWDASGVEEDWGADGEGMKAFVCPSCGAELVCDETTAATSCPYCGNPSVVPGQFTGVAKPDFVLPFKLSRDDAIKALKKHYQGKRLLPSVFTNENHLEEIQGVYVPFWLFDGEAEGNVSYHATRVHTHTMGDYEITETDHFDVRRAGSMSFEKIPVDASSKMPDDHMDSIEPFDYSELKPFSKAYLPGFLADKYDQSAEESSKRADARCESSILSALEKTVSGYSTCIPVEKNVRLQRGKVHYALLPVWMLSTRWNGQNFLFAMNGQTGKLVGDLPVSKQKLAAYFAAIAVPLMAIGTVLALLL